MKRLTHEVFKREDCPTWAKSAFVCSRGAGWWCDSTDTKPRPRLGTHATPRTSTKYKQIGSEYGIYDTTNWQKSAINREQIQTQ